MNSSSWRLEGVDGGDEQYPVESRFAVRHTPPDEQDPVPNVGGLFPLFCGMPGLVSIACSVQALPMNTTMHSVPTHEHDDDAVSPFRPSHVRMRE